MTDNELIRVATGHRDCCGYMIYDGDTVITRNGHGRVAWIQGKWYLRFSGLDVEALNRYPADAIRRLTEDGTIASVPSVGQETIVPGQRNDCPTIVPSIVPPSKRSKSVGYLHNGTMGQ